MQAAGTVQYRARLLEGLAAAMSERGYVDVTIADIVRHAKVSKRTFYEHFEDKDACFVATYAAMSDLILGAVAFTFDQRSAEPWESQVDAAVDAYVTALETNPVLTRSCLLEIQSAGPKALELRREVLQKFAKMMRAFVDRTRKKHLEVQPVTLEMAMALVGGINELLVAQVERGPQHRLASLRETASALIKAVLTRRVATPRARR